jgi:hypothetical protein
MRMCHAPPTTVPTSLSRGTPFSPIQESDDRVVTVVRNIGQGESRRRKYKRLKLGGGQTYDRSNV